MPKVEKGELRVPAIKNGSVIDHIPVEDLPKVVHLLDLFDLEYPLTIGYNFKSSKLGKKGIIKVEEKLFSPEEVNMIALVSPDVVINTIQNYEVVEKMKVHLPSEVTGLVRCTNPKCITNNEPMKGRFTVLDEEKGVLRCYYCMRKIERQEILLIKDTL
ncbi:MAG: aspartate carbamoyltransferase regulatory subunit [Porphyromonas sp.]|nr:aspartate carbamoyltransferase regulatory subunit [Porphyromonas sp.]